MLTYLHQNTATLFKPGGLFQVDKTCQKHAPNCTINNIKMQKALTVGGGGAPPSHTLPPPARSLGRFAPSQVIFYRPPKIKSWLRHWLTEKVIFTGSVIGLAPHTPVPRQIYARQIFFCQTNMST